MKRLAIIDDYENAAANAADWATIRDQIEVTVFGDHLETESDIAERLRPFDAVVIMRERTAFRRTLLDRLPNLELLITSGKRNASIDVAAARRRGIIVCGTPILPYPAAEHTWALILALAKRIPADDRRMRTGQWGADVNIGLNGKSLGIVGLGKLGAQVARVGLAFGMKVAAWSENLTREHCAEVGIDYASKENLLADADFVTIHLVLGERSRSLIGADEIALMKPTAYLINTSRGPIVDEKALVAALESHSIAGAGIDVYDVEPLPPSHPLRSLPNTVLTPHQGYVTRENFEIFFGTAIDNLRAWLAGAPINVLD